MRERQDPSPALVRLALAQDGALSTEQILRSGLGRHAMARLVESGQWQRLARGLIFAGAQQPPWLALAWGGVLLGGPHSRIAGEAAGYLHQLRGQAPTTIDVLVPHGAKVRRVDPWVFRQEMPGARGRSYSEPPRTSPADTVLDLAAEAQEGEVIDLVLSAVQNRCVSPEALRRALSRRNRQAHRRLISNLIDDSGSGLQSTLEREYAAVERAHGLPKGQRQHPNLAGHYRDVRYDPYATVVELDGRLGHRGMGRFRDMRRDNLAAVLGETAMRFGYWDVHSSGCLVARQVGWVLADRGWTGIVVTCPKCRSVPISDVVVP